LKPRILVCPKDHPELSSGYGIMTHHLLPRLAAHYGKDSLFVLAPVPQALYVGEYQGMKVLPGPRQDWGEDIMLQHYHQYECNMLLHIGDVWPLGPLTDWARAGEVHWVSWMAVDWMGMPKNILYRIDAAHWLVPFSRYGENSLRKTGLTNVGEAIWIGLDLDIWRPLSPEVVAREGPRFGYVDSPDVLNILIVGANQERKGILQQLEGIALWHKRTNHKFHLYLHSMARGERDFLADLDELGIRSFVRMPDPYILESGGFPEQDMVVPFCCADLLLNVCQEGFGMSVAQAQAVGLPVVILSESACTEFTVYGWETPPGDVFVTGANQHRSAVPNPAAIAAVLDEAAEMKKAGKLQRSQKAIDYIRKNMSWDLIAQKWIKTIDSCMERYEASCPVPPLPARNSQEIREVPWLA